MRVRFPPGAFGVKRYGGKMKDNFVDKFKDILVRVKKVLPIFAKYKKYAVTLGLFALVVITLYFFTGEDYIAKRLEAMNSRPVSGEDYVPDKEFEIDAYEEVNELITTYFEAYVNADIETLETVAHPISEMEKTYVGVITSYYEEYQNIKCYTKHGLSKDSFIVAAYYEIKFVDIEQAAPSMELFYVQTDENGELYINNLYSDFNRRYKENSVNRDVNTAFVKFITQDDYVELDREVENAYKNLIMENEEIYILTKRTIPALRQEWEDTVYYAHEEDTESATGTEGTQETEVTDPTQGTDDTQETEEPQGTESQSQLPSSEEPSSTPQDPVVQEPVAPEPVVVYVRALKNEVMVRSEPNTNCDVLGKANMGDTFEKIEDVGDWTKIKYKDGYVGYIKSTLIEVVTE